MRLMTYVIIAVGIMFLLNVAGVETGASGLILQNFFPGFSSTGNVTFQNASINQSAGSGIDVGSSTYETLKGLITGSGVAFWSAMAAIITFIGALAFFRVSGVVVSFQPDALRVGYSIFGGVILFIVWTDLVAVTNYVGSLTNNTGFIYLIVISFMFIFLIGFAFSILKFLTSGE